MEPATTRCAHQRAAISTAKLDVTVVVPFRIYRCSLSMTWRSVLRELTESKSAKIRQNSRKLHSSTSPGPRGPACGSPFCLRSKIFASNDRRTRHSAMDGGNGLREMTILEPKATGQIHLRQPATDDWRACYPLLATERTVAAIPSLMLCCAIDSPGLQPRGWRRLRAVVRQ